MTEAQARANATTHGMSYTSTYRCWDSMIQRCLNPRQAGYRYYGGRGVTVCDRWRISFETFYTDMGERPRDRFLDRINNNGNYEPGNCRWATRDEQSSNRRHNVWIEFRGERKTISQWEREFGFNPNVLRRRLLHLGWSTEKAMKERRR